MNKSNHAVFDNYIQYLQINTHTLLKIKIKKKIIPFVVKVIIWATEINNKKIKAKKLERILLIHKEKSELPKKKYTISIYLYATKTLISSS